jgi:signal peptidase I
VEPVGVGGDHDAGIGEAALVTPRGAIGPRRGVAFAAALATLWVSAAIGCVAVRRWRRALFWLLTDWAWIVVVVVAAVTGHPRLWWGGILAFLGWHVPAAIDAYRVVARARAEATWPTLVKAWLVLTVGAIVMAAGVIRPFFSEAFQIPSKGMVPTLIVGDHIMVDKLHHSVRRGDVVVFRWPPDPSVEYVKRVVGLPGDVVELAQGRLSINGAALPRERYQDECPTGPDGATAFEDATPCVLWHETLDGRTYDIGTETVLGEGRDFVAQVVPAGAVFVLGDNRDNSSDSRMWGDVPLANVKGVVRFIWWSSSGEGMRGEVRWDRVDTLVR